jgi:hypothetical protein
MFEQVIRACVTREHYNFGRRDGFDPRCCGTCRFAILRGGQRSSAALRRYCQIRYAWLPSKDRERLRTVGCDAHELDDASAEALALWNRLTPDEHGWSERDFARLRR